MSKHILRKHLHGFTTVSNNVIKALRTDLEALGFYLYLISLPNDWQFYKSVMCKDCSIGIKRLEKLLDKLCAFNLVQIRRARDEKGRFAHFEVDVYDTEIIEMRKEETEIAQNEASVHPHGHSGHLDSAGGRQSAAIKETSTKEEKNKSKSSCASDDARAKESLFESFWRSYPIKKNRKRSLEVWSKKNLDKIAEVIINHVAKSILQDSQWAQGYAPHPASYLTNERWEDEITQAKPKEVHQVHNKAQETTQAKQEAQDYAKCAACQRPHLYCECGRPAEVTTVNRELIKKTIADAKAALMKKCGTTVGRGTQ